MFNRTMKMLPALLTAMTGLATMNVASARPVHQHHALQQVGEASFYSSKFVGRRTASGERYDPSAMTAAHPWLPLGTRVRVVREDSQKSVVVTVTDRQALNGRVIDLSRRAAEQLGILHQGTAAVRLVALNRAVSRKLNVGGQRVRTRHRGMADARGRQVAGRSPALKRL